MIQIHPKRAFLNSDVVISNKGKESAIIEDSKTHESFNLSPGEYRSSRYPAGEHSISIKWLSGDIEDQTFIVEDALKFGGSKRKGTYVFDTNPWAIIVMRDRTYFLNEETKEQFVEHNLSPDKIEEVSPDYLLFSTGKDYSFFSLLSMTFEKTLSACECVYRGCGHCVLSSDDGLYLYRLDPQFKGQRLDFIKCDEYVINKETGIIYAFNKGDANNVLAIKLMSQPENNEYEQQSTVEIDGHFVCFISCHSLLYTKSNLKNGDPNMLYSKSLSQVGSTSLIYSGEQLISSINGISIWGSNSYDEIYDKYCQNRILYGEGHRLTIDVIENSMKYYYIQTIETIIINNKKIQERKVASSLFSNGTLIHRDDSKRLSFAHKGIYDYVTCENFTYIFYNSSYKKIDDKVFFTTLDDPYTKVECSRGNLYTSIDGVQIKCKEGKSRPSYGLFFIKEDNNEFFYWLKTNKRYIGNSIQTAGDTVIVSGGQTNIPPRFILKSGDIIPVPKSTEDMITLSTTGRTILFKKGGYYSFARYINKIWNYSDDLALSIYDTLRVKDAVFCSDGDSFIFQKDNELVLFDFGTGDETIFESRTGITYNVNGYRPYCKRDYFSRPVIVDPLSHRIIDHNFLSQYQFSNIEGDVYFKERIIRRCLKENNCVVSDLEYQSLKDKYNYTPGLDTNTKASILRNRMCYLQIKNGSLHDKYLSYVLKTPDFVDLLLVKDEEFAVIYRYGRRIEIRIGPPLYYLNYVAFSIDSNNVAICGKYKDSSGLCIIYDLVKEEEIYRSKPIVSGRDKIMAIWLGLFSKKGDVAYYDSTPNTYFLRGGEKITKIQGRSFLTFSPSGKLMALSKQGYTRYSDTGAFWGHQPSCDIYIARTNDPNNCLCHFNDHGSGIAGIGVRRGTVASASFSIDEKRILSVSNDGVVVVRNLHLDAEAE